MPLDYRKKNWLYIGGSALILVILLIILFSGILSPKQPSGLEKVKNKLTPPEENTEIIKPATYTAENIINPNIQIDDRGRSEIQLEKKAAAFIERWASLSNQDNFSNIEILKNEMTEEMLAWTDEYLKKQPEQKNTSIYQGTSAKAIVSDGTLSSNQADSLTVKVKVRGQEMLVTSNNQNKTFYQTYDLELKKINGLWLANKLTWQDRQY
ncbi:MAG TPA: hypothetical protein PLT32_03070 [bacterium]|nr:hypothetical protein [bacterium]